MFSNLKADLERYTRLSNKPWWYHLLLTPGVWATAQYRYCRWVHNSVHIPVLRQALKAFGFVWMKLVHLNTGICIDRAAEIGKGLFIGHFGCIFVAGKVKMGEMCNLSQGVTVGWGGRKNTKGCPTLGDRVYIGAGAKVLGKITVGSNVAIGANAVVTKDVPDNAVVVGIPARVINYNGSKDFIDWEDD